MRQPRALFIVLCCSALAACGSLPQSDTECAGPWPPVAGLREASDPALLAAARGRAGEGRLCDARVYVADRPLTLHRVWDAGHAWTEFGMWWAPDAPALSRDAYRERYAICPSWSKLDRQITCTLEAGSVLVLGTGQGVACPAPEPALPPSAALQAYLPGGSSRFASCSSAPWP